MKIFQSIKFALNKLRTLPPPENREAKLDAQIDSLCTMLKGIFDDSKLAYQFHKEEACFYGMLCVNGIDNLVLVLRPRADYIHSQVIAFKRAIPALKLTEALLFCNKWNSKSLFPKAYIDDSNNTLIAETVMTFGEETSEEFVRECILKNLISANITFFEEALERKVISKNLWDSGMILFNQEHAAQIWDFVGTGSLPFYVHCQAGISRSGAVGEVLNWYFNSYVQQNFDAFAAFYQEHPQIEPNPHIRTVLLETLDRRLNLKNRRSWNLLKQEIENIKHIQVNL